MSGAGAPIVASLRAQEATPTSPGETVYSTSATACNDRGQVVGMFLVDEQPAALLIDAGQPVLLPCLAGDVGAGAHDVNNEGQIAGFSMDGAGSRRAVVWRGTEVIDLGMPADAMDAIAGGINESAQVVGSVTFDDGERATLWDGEEVVDLGTLPGASSSRALAISDSGVIVGWSTGANEYTHAVRWIGSEIEDLGTLPGATSSFAYDVNAAGQIVGGSGSEGEIRAVLWSEDGITDLGALGDDPNCRAVAINDGGFIAGWSGSQDEGWHPVLWRDTTPQTLETLDDDPVGVAEDINNHNQVIGWCGTTRRHQAVIWGDGPVHGLNTIPGERFRGAPAINAAGHVAGYSDDHAVFWTEGILAELPSLAGGEVSKAWAINDASQVAGWSTAADGTLHAVVWERGEIVDLGRPPGYEASAAMAINASGAVAGFAMDEQDHSHAVLWKSGAITVLEPLPGDIECTALGLNDSGQVVGKSGSGYFESGNVSLATARAVQWQDGQVTALEPLVAEMESRCVAVSINQAGQVVGYATDADRVSHAVMWDNGDVIDLGIPANTTSSYAYGCNLQGQVVGYAPEDGWDKQHAILWQDGRAIVLDSLPGSGYSSAMAINEEGVIVGYSGRYDYDTHAVRWLDGDILDLGIPPVREPEAGSAAQDRRPHRALRHWQVARSAARTTP